MFRNGLEPWHVILVVVVFVLLFGYKKMPDAARGLGKSLRILKSETRALREEGKDKDAKDGSAESSSADEPRPKEALDKAPAPAPTEPARDQQQHTA
jgi:sec-independent protein translocase protein TatA